MRAATSCSRARGRPGARRPVRRAGRRPGRLPGVDGAAPVGSTGPGAAPRADGRLPVAGGEGARCRRTGHRSSGTGRRYRTHRTIRSLLERMAARPLVLALDDLQWADAATTELIAFLLLGAARLLLALAARTAAMPATLDRALAAAERDERNAAAGRHRIWNRFHRTRGRALPTSRAGEGPAPAIYRRAEAIHSTCSNCPTATRRRPTGSAVPRCPGSRRSGAAAPRRSPPAATARSRQRGRSANSSSRSWWPRRRSETCPSCSPRSTS